MNKLTTKDVKVLNALPVPANQRLFIERHWAGTEEEKSGLFVRFLWLLALPVTVVLMATAYLTGRPELHNLGLMMTWLIIVLSTTLSLLTMLGYKAMETHDPFDNSQKRKKLLLSRPSIKQLLKPSFLRRIYDVILTCMWVVLTAILGHYFLALVILASEAIWASCRNSIKKTLTDYLSYTCPPEVVDLELVGIPDTWRGFGKKRK